MAAAALPCLGLAQETTPSLPLLKPKLKSLAAFKNGLGFCVKTGQVHFKNGWAELEGLPAASLGALWIGTDAKGGPVTELIAFKTNVTEETPVLTQTDLLAVNAGQHVRLTYASGTVSEVQCLSFWRRASAAGGVEARPNLSVHSRRQNTGFTGLLSPAACVLSAHRGEQTFEHQNLFWHGQLLVAGSGRALRRLRMVCNRRASGQVVWWKGCCSAAGIHEDQSRPVGGQELVAFEGEFWYVSSSHLG